MVLFQEFNSKIRGCVSTQSVKKIVQDNPLKLIRTKSESSRTVKAHETILTSDYAHDFHHFSRPRDRSETFSRYRRLTRSIFHVYNCAERGNYLAIFLPAFLVFKLRQLVTIYHTCFWKQVPSRRGFTLILTGSGHFCYIFRSSSLNRRRASFHRDLAICQRNNAARRLENQKQRRKEAKKSHKSGKRVACFHN